MDIQLLQKAVAKQHNESLPENDPIFITATIHELVLSHYVDKVNAAVEDSQRAIALSTTEQLQATKQKTSEILTSAAEYIAEQMTAVHAELQTKLLEAVDQKIADAHLATEQMRTSKRIALWAAFVSVGATCFTIGDG